MSSGSIVCPGSVCVSIVCGMPAELFVCEIPGALLGPTYRYVARAFHSMQVLQHRLSGTSKLNNEHSTYPCARHSHAEFRALSSPVGGPPSFAIAAENPSLASVFQTNPRLLPLLLLASCCASVSLGQTLFTIADNTANVAGGISFTGVQVVTPPATTGTAICNGVRIGAAALVMSTTYYPYELDIAPFKTAATAETTGYPVLVSVELWPMTAGGLGMVQAIPGTPITTMTTVITTLPGNVGLTNAYVRVPVTSAFVLTGGSSFLLSINIGSTCTSSLKFSWNRPSLTPTAPLPQTGVTGERPANIASCPALHHLYPCLRVAAGVTYTNSQWTSGAGSAWISFVVARPWWRSTAYLAKPPWTTMWIDSTAALTAPRANTPIAVETKVAAWCIRAPTELGNAVFWMYNVSIVSGRVYGGAVCLPSCCW